MKDFRIEALIEATDLLNNRSTNLAVQIINSKYPFNAIKNMGRNYSVKQMIEQFFRDGFIDRYSGNRLINPGMLRVLSEMMPSAFPYQAHWKTDECHIAYWDYQPTVDHIYPVSLGGKDSEENWATTSMMNNSAKSNFTLEQLNWTLKDRENIKEWDGLSKSFVELVDKQQSLLEINRIKSYYNETKKLLNKYEI